MKKTRAQIQAGLRERDTRLAKLETQFKREVKQALVRVLIDRFKVKPDVIKPQSVSQHEFIWNPLRASSEIDWERVDDNYIEINFFDWGFHEKNRVRAERVGIVYEQKIIDFVPERSRERIRRLIADKLERIRRGDRVNLDFERLKDFDPEMYSLENNYVVHLTPITQRGRHLNHDVTLFPDANILESLDREFFDWFVACLRKGTLYNAFEKNNKFAFTFLKEYESAKSAYPDSVSGHAGLVTVRFHIDVARLLESRNVFTDPEALIIPDEYGKTYMVKGGIPINAIDGWSFWEGDAPPRYVELP